MASASLDAKRISELQLALSSDLTERDVLPIDVFNASIGYTITKQIKLKDLAAWLYSQISASVSGDIHLGELAFTSYQQLLEKFLSGHNPKRQDSSECLALSVLDDLNLGDLSSANYADLCLTAYLQKSDLNQLWPAYDKKYIKSIRQANGLISEVTYGSISDDMAVDTSLDSSSMNAIANSAVKAALDAKVSTSDANADLASGDGKYITGIHQKNGKITYVDTAALSDVTSSAQTGLQKQVDLLQSQVDALQSQLAGLRTYVDSTFLKTGVTSQQYVIGPVTYKQTIQGNITNADTAVKCTSCQKTTASNGDKYVSISVPSKVTCIDSLAGTTSQYELRDYLMSVYNNGTKVDCSVLVCKAKSMKRDQHHLPKKTYTFTAAQRCILCITVGGAHGWGYSYALKIRDLSKSGYLHNVERQELVTKTCYMYLPANSKIEIEAVWTLVDTYHFDVALGIQKVTF